MCVCIAYICVLPYWHACIHMLAGFYDGDTDISFFMMEIRISGGLQMRGGKEEGMGAEVCAGV